MRARRRANGEMNATADHSNEPPEDPFQQFDDWQAERTRIDRLPPEPDEEPRPRSIRGRVCQGVFTRPRAKANPPAGSKKVVEIGRDGTPILTNGENATLRSRHTAEEQGTGEDRSGASTSKDGETGMSGSLSHDRSAYRRSPLGGDPRGGRPPLAWHAQVTPGHQEM